MHSPDRWVIVKVIGGYKVLGGWSGGYLDSDNWRLSSGLERIEVDPDNEDFYLMHNFSGSIYRCHKKTEGMTALSGSIFSQLQELSDEVKTVSVEEFNEATKDDSGESKN